MNVLVINSGSSSLKYQLFEMEKEIVLAKGIVERIGLETAIVQYEPKNGESKRVVCEILEHKDGLLKVLDLLTDSEIGVIKSMKDIDAVGHRITHGGEAFADSVLVDSTVVQAIEKNIELAPLHNPANLKGIYALQEILRETPMVCVFDTAFHQTMPEKSFMYGLPRVLYKKYKIRRYGFHGTSHKYVSSRLSQMTNMPLEGNKIISCHIGNGASITAIKDGRSVDTSMGMTPLEGLLMGTRSGDLDPAIIPFLMVKEDLTVDEVNSLLNKHSGLAGISGLSSDLREVIEGMENGDEGCQLALDMYVYRMIKYIGAYAAIMNGVDTIIFTGGVGENSDYVRASVCEQLTYLGLEIDPDLNKIRTPKERKISAENSRTEVYIIPTNEELMIARETKQRVYAVREGSHQHA